MIPVGPAPIEVKAPPAPGFAATHGPAAAKDVEVTTAPHARAPQTRVRLTAFRNDRMGLPQVPDRGRRNALRDGPALPRLAGVGIDHQGRLVHDLELVRGHRAQLRHEGVRPAWIVGAAEAPVRADV